jgi:adenylate cyclase
VPVAPETAPQVLLSLPDKPSIAVLPFQNMSGDPEQEYFADGITEDIITALSRWRSFRVISRTSAFTYKGRAVDVRRVGTELGVRYVLEGSVRKAGNRVRVTAQLISADDGTHIWAERYDRELVDLFAVQDEITQRIASVIEPELGRHAQASAAATKPTTTVAAWDCLHRGLFLLFKLTKADIAASRAFFERAIEIDPSLSRAYVSLAYTHQLDVLHGYTEDRARSVAEHLRLAKLGVQFDDSDSYAQTMLNFAYCRVGEHDLAVAAGRKAVELNPYDAWAQVALGRAYDLCGDPDFAVRQCELAIALAPRDPHMRFHWQVGARALINKRDYHKASEWARKAIECDPTQARPYLLLAIALGYLGRRDEARVALDTADRVVPGYSGRWREWSEYRNPADQEHMRAGLAGLKEQ